MNYYSYFSEIEEVFIRRRGRNLLLSPLDWALIESWQEREVPLHIILRGIEQVFDQADKQPNKKRPIKSLLYCKGEIEAQYAEWLESQVGRRKAESVGLRSEGNTAAVSEQSLKIDENNSSKSDLFPDATIAAHLETVSGELKAAIEIAGGDWRASLEAVLAQLDKLRRKPETAEATEAVLEKLDALVDENLLRNFEIGALKPEIETQIAGYKSKMEPEVYRRTFDLMLLKRLREKSNVPRFSLFYL